jgi:hypothetical protein
MTTTDKIYLVAVGIGFYTLAFFVMLFDAPLKVVLLRRPR